MRIKKIRLKNGYKRFYDLTIDLGSDPKRLVALVGPNGCGKSSVFDGMLFANAAYAGPIGSPGQRDYKYHSMNAEFNYTYQNIEVEFDAGSMKDVVKSRLSAGTATSLFSFRSPYRYNSDVNVTQISAVGDIRGNLSGASVASDIDGKMEENYRRLYIARMRYLKSADCRLSEANQKIIGDLNNSLERCLDLRISDLGDVDDSRGTLYFRKPDQAKEFSFNSLSSGEKEVVDILLDIYLRKDDYNETIFLFDEPELHISTATQGNLLREINNLVGPNCQIWISTHSIGFLRAIRDNLAEDCQIVQFKSSNDAGSKPLTPTPVEPSHLTWRDLFGVALDDLAYLVCPKRIIYCEGRDLPGAGGFDRGLDARVFNRIFVREFPDTLFVSSGGNTELDQRSAVAIAILSKAISGLEVWTLKDMDITSGRPTTIDDRSDYLKTNGTEARILGRKEIENYLYDKEVLKAYCARRDSDFNDEKYDVLVTDIINQSVKDFTGEIKKVCGIQVSINPEIFKLSLAECITPDMKIYSDLSKCIFERM